VVNHPNRNRLHRSRNPTKEEIRAARDALGMTQSEAAYVIHSSLIAWQKWEAGDRRMHAAFWDLFRRKTGVKVPVAAPSVASEAEAPGVEEKPPDPV
jgi:DNA (cytosine-5)-methyltransferase 1